MITEKEKQELNDLYKENSVEREILDYSSSNSIAEEVPPLIRKSFWLIMISGAAAGISMLIQYFSH